MRILFIFFTVFCLFTASSCATRVVYQPKKVVVKRPVKYKVVRVKGKKYFVWNGRYHRKTRRGYVVMKF